MSVLSFAKKTVIATTEKSITGEMFYYRVKYGTAKIMRKLLGEEGYAKWFYHLYSGKKLNLDNPQIFNEKAWWLKLNNRDPRMTICSDKNAVREYVKEAGYEDILIPQVDVVESIDELDFSKYDFPVVAKCNHNSGGHFFYDPQNAASDKEIKLAKKRLNFILHHNASVLSLEWNYKNIPPKIVVEKVIRDKNGNLPFDYKFLCFNGEPKLLILDLGLISEDGKYKRHSERTIRDMNFEYFPIEWGRENYSGHVEKPEHFDRMIEIAKTLSSPFVMCRVDLYNVDGKIYFGEITFFHDGASKDVGNDEWDYKMGSWIDLNSPKIVRE